MLQTALPEREKSPTSNKTLTPQSRMGNGTLAAIRNGLSNFEHYLGHVACDFDWPLKDTFHGCLRRDL